METDLEVDLTEFEAQFARFMVYSRRSLEEEFRARCKGLIETVLYITPPAHGKGTRGRARRMGQAKIAGDLAGRRGGVRSQMRAGIYTVLSDSLIDSALETGLYQTNNVRLFVKKDGTVYGTERQFFRPDATISEMREHHKRFFKDGIMTAAGAHTRDVGRWRFIDQMVVRASTFQRYLRHVQRKVGIYSAGFRPAAEGVGVSLSPYMKNHAAIGSFELKITGEGMGMRAVNAVGYGRIDRDLRRRIQWAVNEEVRKMERQIPSMIRKYGPVVD